jgi:hypothetical protein
MRNLRVRECVGEKRLEPLPNLDRGGKVGDEGLVLDHRLERGSRLVERTGIFARGNPRLDVRELRLEPDPSG